MTEEQKNKLRETIRGMLARGERIPVTPVVRLGEQYKDHEREVYSIVNEEIVLFEKKEKAREFCQEQLKIFLGRIKVLFEEVQQNILNEVNTYFQNQYYKTTKKEISQSAIDKILGIKDLALRSSLHNILENAEGLEEFREQLGDELRKLRFWQRKQKKTIVDLKENELLSVSPLRENYFVIKEKEKESAGGNHSANQALDEAVKKYVPVLKEAKEKDKEIFEQTGIQTDLFGKLLNKIAVQGDNLSSEIKKKIAPRDYDFFKKRYEEIVSKITRQLCDMHRNI